ncbi:hypothetical protein CR194_18315 [Salipaludibacillus keqinensis]|jgi:uncharacterized beta-barrel protein YwiB (DUF1934 family)|uniref:DUF1934 domain-containing protein n=1 Tax=Salipaludibacillus keqinensis TaxID=2045207 RepID=A0A323T8C2_9BACI|nr:DUF1934 domain-containing protein [Salipaludibacillus keqinensis]PYZ91590.1 hypothetical protein CR194_18315 [Salipaludibacillus keqinensis]
MSSSGLPVSVQMKTTIKDGKRKEIHTMEATGNLYQRGELTVLRFSEPKEENDEASTTQTVKLNRGEMSVQRKGAITMNQRFVPGIETEGMYHSQFGPMSMLTDTSEVNYNWDKEAREGWIALRYTLVLQGSQTGNYDMYVKIKEV